MRKFALVIMAVGFSFAVAGAPVMAASHKKAKDAPGKCGVMKYFDTKTKKCKSKG